MSKLIFDIETIGEDFDTLDQVTQESLTHWIKKEAGTEKERQAILEDLKAGLGFSALTGEIVCIGVLDYEKDQGVVYFQALGKDIKEFEEGGIRFKAMDEKAMLKNFWQGVAQYQEFISFNGRGFDAPYLMIRSAIHKLKPSKNLMAHRYLGSQPWEAKHIDLLDQLTFYGAVRRRGNLHLWSRAFGIKSPKAEGVDGDDVSRLFKEKKFVEIAKYNVGDLKATKELYEYWEKYIKF